LCGSCNAALGHFGDSEELLDKASHYLGKYRQSRLALVK
jgi:hypothetical protein